MQRTTWTDERLDERMAATDQTAERIFAELAGIREEMRASRSDMSAFRDEVGGEISDLRNEIGRLRSDVKGEISDLRNEIGRLRSDVKGEIGDIRSDTAAHHANLIHFQDRMIQVGFGLLGVTIASITAIFIALISGGG